MPKYISNWDDQFIFLVTCIKHAKNGRPDFDRVAEERGIISKAAAQKRYCRLMKHHGITLGSTTGDRLSSPVTDIDDDEPRKLNKKRKRGKGPAAKRVAKKPKQKGQTKSEDNKEETKGQDKGEGAVEKEE
ncbi:hypothetical protein ABW19_dt0203203 [Dactylella cylindrospora]|nr:hypothetical protein ABW19_dt0203203 [Dactylella cylindrospora]